MSALELQIKHLVNHVPGDKYDKEILQIKIEGLIKSALLEQQFDIVNGLRVELDNDIAADFVRNLGYEI